MQPGRRSKDATRGSWPYYILGARTLLGAPGLNTRSKDATRILAVLLARTLLGAPGLSASSKNATVVNAVHTTGKLLYRYVQVDVCFICFQENEGISSSGYKRTSHHVAL